MRSLASLDLDLSHSRGQSLPTSTLSTTYENYLCGYSKGMALMMALVWTLRGIYG